MYEKLELYSTFRLLLVRRSLYRTNRTALRELLQARVMHWTYREKDYRKTIDGVENDIIRVNDELRRRKNL